MECGRHTERTHNLRGHILKLNASQPEVTAEAVTPGATEDDTVIPVET